MTLPKNQCADSANDDCHAQQCESWPSASAPPQGCFYLSLESKHVQQSFIVLQGRLKNEKAVAKKEAKVSISRKTKNNLVCFLGK